MSINIPNNDQWQRMNETLANIANALGTQIDISTWSGIQKAVRAGVAPAMMPIGTQLLVSHRKYGDMLYDVVAHDHFKSAKNENAHTMTLMCHDSIPAIQYDESEAFYYAQSELPAGTYNFTINTAHGDWEVGTYQFTLAKAVPVGGRMCFNHMTAGVILTYDSQISDTRIERTFAKPGNGGTHLGTLGKELNHLQRVLYGSNNYKESAIRQFLNSSAKASSVWTPQTKFDRPPLWVNSLDGFVNGLDAELVSAVGSVIVPCATNSIYESPDSGVTVGKQYTINDKFYLPSHAEIFGTPTLDGSVVFPYYDGASNVDRIKYNNGVATSWATRTALPTYSNRHQIINDNGSEGDMQCIVECRVTPVFTIV